MTLTSGRVRKYRPLLTEDTGVFPKKHAWLVAVIFCIDNARITRYTLGARCLSKNTVAPNSPPPQFKIMGALLIYSSKLLSVKNTKIQTKFGSGCCILHSATNYVQLQCSQFCILLGPKLPVIRVCAQTWMFFTQSRVAVLNLLVPAGVLFFPVNLARNSPLTDQQQIWIWSPCSERPPSDIYTLWRTITVTCGTAPM
jgi:hypothetical protein